MNNSMLKLLGLFAVTALSIPAAAQSPDGAAEGDPLTLSGTPEASDRAVAVRVSERPVLDGRLDDEVWAAATPVTGFVDREPVEGIRSVDDTEVRIVYTDEAIYFGATMYGDPAEIRADVTRRDEVGDAEILGISLDTYLDRRTAYTFVVTAGGGRVDYYHAADYEDRRDYSFDPVWEVETGRFPGGWVAEVRIPFTQLRFSPADQQAWGLNLMRMRPGLQRESFWQLVGRNETGWSSRMGRLEGLSGIRPGRRVELQPYVASAATLQNGADPLNPFQSDRSGAVRVGGDLKVGIGPNLTLDATFNPDFGQVEADPAVVNLSAFEVFYQERRPFFTEGAQLFDWGNQFYSRRIGAPPHLDPDADYAEQIDNTTILGAAKLTGQLPSGLSIGVLGALTDRETASIYDGETGEFGSVAVEPLAGYGAARLEQQFGEDGSTIGAILTGVGRRVEDGSDLARLLNRTAVSGGVDGRFRWKGGEYDLGWAAGFTHIEGSPEAIVRQQTSSRRYYQRPDASHVAVDSTRTSLDGYVLLLNHSRSGAPHWLWNVDFWAESPGYEPNDLGSLSRADGIGGFAQLRYRETTPGSLFRSYSASLLTQAEWTYGGERTNAWSGMELDAELPNFWEVGAFLELLPTSYSAVRTRGGPLMRTSGVFSYNLNVSSPDGRDVSGDAYVTSSRFSEGGGRFRTGVGLSYRPTSRLQLSASPRYSHLVDPFQYVATRDGGTEATFGKRYIFAEIDQTEIAMRLRANYALGPDLTVEGYMEPFVSNGRYSAFGELAAARTTDLRPYGGLSPNPDGEFVVTDGPDRFTFDDPGYHVRSLRSNLVFRWEWRRGSTLYLVWQQNRAADDSARDRATARDLLHSLTTEGDNFFALKMTYWVG